MKTLVDWPSINLGEVCKFAGGNGFREELQGRKDGDYPFIKVSDMELPGNTKEIVEANNWIDEKTRIKEAFKTFPQLSVVFAKVGAALLLNRRRILTRPTCIDNNMMAAVPRGIEPLFLYYVLSYIDFADFVLSGAVPSINQGQLTSISFVLPKPSEQSKIAEILSTVDRAIEQTEGLIAKQQLIKTGLMQDLLTRGIDEHGNLRSEQTHKFKDSPLGRIPVKWEVDGFGSTVESAVDGPFGSNLKSEHYVTEPGVRVIRLGNIGNGKFLDQDKAWISSEHGRFLSRHLVQPMDLLIASLGDERHLFGRACIYADHIHEAIVKADVFRVRCKKEKFVHSFVVYLFNFPHWRQGLFALAQGVTRDRVNLTNIMLLQLPIPPVAEQKKIAYILDSIDAFLDELERELAKLRSLKTALMQDLLTGRKRVSNLLNNIENVEVPA